MKKFALMFMVFVLSLTVAGSALANMDNTNTKQTTMTIEKVYYAKGSGYYLAHTSKDQEGHFWVLQVTDIATKKEDKSFVQVLCKQYQGKQVIVTYIEPIDSDEEVEILNVKLK